MTTRLTKWTVALTAAACLPLSSQALSISSPERIVTFDDATAFQMGAGNPLRSDIAGEFTSAQSWTLRGNVFSGTATQDLLTVNFTSGSWGATEATGTWTLASSFWHSFASAVIAIHLGGSGNDSIPDHFSFLLTPGATSGTWSYKKLSDNGGGLSNLRLFATAAPTNNEVPDGGSTLALLSLAVASIGILRRKLA